MVDKNKRFSVFLEHVLNLVQFILLIFSLELQLVSELASSLLVFVLVMVSSPFNSPLFNILS